MKQLEKDQQAHIAQLKMAEANYFELFNKANIAILILEAATCKILDANSMASNLTGYSREELINKHPYDTVSSLDDTISKISAAENIRRVMDGEHLISDRQYIHKNGQVFWIQVSLSRAVIDGCERVIVCFYEIDSRKKAEQALRKSEANLRSIFNHTHIGFALLDQSLNIVCCNTAANEWGRDSLGVELAEGKNVIPLLRDYNKKEYVELLHRALGGESINFETAYPVLDGSISWYRVRMDAVYTPEEHIIGIIVSAENITDNKLARLDRERMIKDLIQRNKEHEQFAYIVSHNLRGPLANILGYINLVQEEGNSKEDTEEYLQMLAASANKLDETIRDLSRLLQLKKDTTDVKEWVSFSSIVEDIKIGLRNLIDENTVVFETDFSEAEEIFTFKIYVYSIFYNLITNSIKYKNQNRRKTVIRIRSCRKGDRVKLTFRDNGIGIDLKKNKEFVFGLYKRFHPQVSNGKGVGLCMTKAQVEALGGKITIKSKVNIGTLFTIYLPYEVAATNLQHG